MADARRLLRDFGGIAFVLALLAAVNLLPPDTSLDDIETAGTLKACVPPSYPPLVTGDPDQPGIDIELLSAIAGKLGVSLGITENAAMGRDFNPRNWALNRAQCQVIAGGVVNSVQTRSFLETSPSYAETGWVVVAPQPVDSLAGLDVGVLTLISGLDRIALSTYLRREGARARVFANADSLAAAIGDGSVAAGVTEAMMGAGLAEEHGWTADWAAPELARYNVVIGLWKGDLTLKRAIDAAFAELSADGTIAAILDRYGVATIS